MIDAYLEAEARAFEHFVAKAPEQWLAVFHPIWPDLERASVPKPASVPTTAATTVDAARTAADPGDEPAERLAREAAR